MKKKLWILSFMMAIVFLMAGANLASASIILTDDNSTVELVADSSEGTTGMVKWQVNSSGDSLVRQWFFISINGGDVIAIDELSDATISNQTANSVEISYNDGGLDVATSYRVNGGPVNISPQSNVSEVIELQNYTSSAMEIRIYEYNDFNILGTKEGDVAERDGSGAILQSEGGVSYAEVIAHSPSGSKIGEAGTVDENGIPSAGSILDLILAGTDFPEGTASDPYDDTLSGNEDMAWVFQWDIVLTAENTENSYFVMSKDKKLVTPVPATLLLFGSGLFSLLGVGIRRKKTA
jgi:hypothetical protein